MIMSLNMDKVWNGTRTVKKVAVARSLEELLIKSRGKLGISEGSAIRLVFEKDGTDIEEDETLTFITKDDVIMVLTVSENWTDTTPVETVVNVYTEPSTETGITPQTPPVTMATTTQSPSTLSQSSSTQSQPCSPTITMIGLPTYSDYVTAKLRAGDSHLVWSKMICEAAHYYLANYPQMGLDNSPSDYRKVGQAMFKHFPTIARDGTQPWSLFTSSLSQKIRRIRWENGRKSISSGSSDPREVSSPKRFRLQPTTDEDAGPDNYDDHIKEMATEIRKKDPNKTHIKTLLKATLRQRRMWIGGLPGGNVSTIMETFPCFRHPAFEDDDLCTLQFLESETSYRHGKGSKTKSVVQIVVIRETDNVEKSLSSPVDSAPRLIAIKNDGQIVNFAIVADSIKILLKTEFVPEAVLCLMAFYYTTDLAYPRCYSQVLGFVQHVALQQPYEGKRTNGFIQLLKKIKFD